MEEIKKESKKPKMPKKVSILIPNRNSLEMIQLCILSIRHYTRYPNYKIVVYDDFSSLPTADGIKGKPNMIDLGFLRKSKRKGWLELHENPGPEVLGHGEVLNKLLNEICDTDYAVIMDADVQIKDYNWLKDLISIAESDPKIIAIMDGRQGGFSNKGCYRMPINYIQFGLINMKAYRDDMQVDWKYEKEDRKKWPYSEEFKDYHPPENCRWSRDFLKLSQAQRDGFDADLVIVDPGAKLYIQVKYCNPRDYKIVPLSLELRKKHHHYSHVNMVVTRLESLRYAYQRCKKEHKEMFSLIREELAKLEKK